MAIVINISGVNFQDYLLWLTEHNGLIYISSEHLNGDHSISSGFFADMPYISDLIVIDEYKQPNKSGRH